MQNCFYTYSILVEKTIRAVQYTILSMQCAAPGWISGVSCRPPNNGSSNVANSWPYQSGPGQVRIQARLAGVQHALLPKRGTTRGATNGGHFRLCGFHL